MAWNWNQAKAAGKHALSYSAGAVTAAAAMGIVSQTDSTTLMAALNDITQGIGQLTKGIVAVAGVLVPIYTAYKAAHNASPQEQIKSVVTNLSAPQIVQAANAVADPQGRNNLITAVALMPEVKGIVAQATTAAASPSDKVVAKAADIPPPVVESKTGVTNMSPGNSSSRL